jgi:hypothetical protein
MAFDACTNPNRRDRGAFGDLPCQLGRNSFEHQKAPARSTAAASSLVDKMSSS